METGISNFDEVDLSPRVIYTSTFGHIFIDLGELFAM